jgi:succinoglycan biosynthesis transport protein ExoP
MSPENLVLTGGSLPPERSPTQIGEARVAFPAMPPPAVSYLIDYWRILLKYRWTIIAFTIIVTTLVSIVSIRMVPQYVAQSLIAIYREGSEGLGLKESKSEEAGDWDSNIDLDTQVKVLQSDTLAMQVIRDLKLDKEPSFAGVSPLDLSDARRQAALLSRFHGALKVTILPRTRVAQIQFTSSNPQLAARVANALSNSYIDQNFKTKFESTTRTSEWLSGQLADLEVKVETSQEKLVQYQKENGILGLDEKQNIVTSKLDDLNKETTQAQADRIAKEAAYKIAQSGNGEYISDGDLLGKLREQQDALQLQLAQATIRLGPVHPKVRELTNQLKQLESSVSTEATRAQLRAKSEYERALSRERMLEDALDAQKREQNQLNESAIDYNLLKRDLDSNRQLYESLLQKLKEAGISASLHSSNIRIIDAALVPAAPSSPNLPRNIALGFIISLAGGMTLALILEKVDNTVTTPEQAEALTGLPSLGFIPVLTPSKVLKHALPSFDLAGTATTLPLKTSTDTPVENRSPAFVAQTKPSSEMAESYRSLRTAILLSGMGKPPKVVMITSSIPQEGKTTTAFNTAIVLAQKGSRVLLIDADLRRPGISKALGLGKREIGLGTVLAGGDKLEDAIFPVPMVKNLWILPAEPLPPHPAELLASEQMHELLMKCRERFDHVLIDTPPVLSVTDAVQLSPWCDAVALVIRAGQTPKNAVRQSSMILGRVGARVLGIIINAVDVHGSDGYYYYYYSAKSKYKYYKTVPSQSPEAS